jgi:hypothetical protein
MLGGMAHRFLQAEFPTLTNATGLCSKYLLLMCKIVTDLIRLIVFHSLEHLIVAPKQIFQIAFGWIA